MYKVFKLTQVTALVKTQHTISPSSLSSFFMGMPFANAAPSPFRLENKTAPQVNKLEIKLQIIQCNITLFLLLF